MKLDQKNIKILNIIQSNSKKTNGELSKELDIPVTTIFERIRKMEKEKVIIGHKAILNKNALNLGLTAFVFIQFNGANFSDDMVEKINNIPFVLELHEVAGVYSYLAKVCAKNTEHLSEILKDYFGPIEGITTTNSHIVLSSHLTHKNYPLKEGL